MRFIPLALALALAVAPAVRAETPGPKRTYMDTTCAPCSDFYKHANGTWLTTAEIPAAYSAIGSSREMFDRNQETLKRVLDHAATNAASEGAPREDPATRKLGILYSVLTDSMRSDREGAEPVREDLTRIDAIRTPADLTKEFARGNGLGRFSPITLQPETDPKQSTMTIAQLFQAGLGLPERDYYFRQDPKSDSTRMAYVAHIERALTLFGMPADQAKAAAPRVLRLETALAESSLSQVQMRDPKMLYHKISVRELSAMAPAIDWPAFFTTAGVPSMAKPEATLDVSQPSFVRRLSKEVQSTPIEDWRAYLRFHSLRGAMNWLSSPIYDEAFRFNSSLTGQKVPLPRWKRAANAVDFAMGDALGKAYVESEFPPASKAKMMEMVDNLQAVFKERIRSRPWMSEATKAQAVRKLESILRKVGYPDRWIDYATLEVDGSVAAVTNLRRAQAFEQKRQYAKIGKPVDRLEWEMTTPTVNAYYNPTHNEIVFPAGILMPPQFDPKADDASNYGAIGMVIGHELTHGFDDEGRQYDAEGNLKDWWTEADGKKFDERAAKVVDQYNGYVAVDTLHVNGKLTLGENIADIGGLTIAYHAWKRSLKGKPAPVIDGMTGEQRFFLSFAQAWRRKFRPELTRLATLSDPHSPAEWRVNGTVSNMPEFTEAFRCKNSDAMVLPEAMRSNIW